MSLAQQRIGRIPQVLDGVNDVIVRSRMELLMDVGIMTERAVDKCIITRLHLVPFHFETQSEEADQIPRDV